MRVKGDTPGTITTTGISAGTAYGVLLAIEGMDRKLGASCPLGPDAGPSRGPKAPWVTAAPSFPHVTRRLAAVLLEQLPDHDTEQTGRCCRRRGLRFGGWLSHDYAWLTARPTGPHAALVCPVGRGSVHGG